MRAGAAESALVTGGASGIGRACALALAARGARVALLDVDEAGLAEAAAAVEDAGGRASTFHTDVTDQGQVEAAVSAAADAWGGLHTVVASAGIEFVGTVEDMSLADFQRVLGVSLIGCFLTAKATVPHLKREGGSFTAIGSTTGINGSNGWGAYSAAKHGVVGLVKCMALDHARNGVRVNAVLPGFIQTPMAARILEGLTQEQLSATDNAIPLGRRADPVEVANAVAHLSSDDASYTTGMLYVVDGGSSAGFYEAPAQ